MFADSAKVSIIVPFYNTQAEFPRCLEALAGQTYKNIEILLIDDASTDGSLKIAEESAQQDKRLRILNQEAVPPLTEKMGVARARNLGLDSARGKYIMFCDSDDYYEPNMVELMVKALEENPEADLASCSVKIHQIGWQHKGIEEWFAHDLKGLQDFTQIQKQREASVLWNKIFKKAIFDGYKIRIRNFTEQGEDENLTNKYKSVSKKIFYVDAALYNYVLRKNSVMGEHISDTFKRAFFLLENLQDFADFLGENHLWAHNETYFAFLLRRVEELFPECYTDIARSLARLAQRISTRSIAPEELSEAVRNWQNGIIKGVPYAKIWVKEHNGEAGARHSAAFVKTYKALGIPFWTVKTASKEKKYCIGKMRVAKKKYGKENMYLYILGLKLFSVGTKKS